VTGKGGRAGANDEEERGDEMRASERGVRENSPYCADRKKKTKEMKAVQREMGWFR
jgi:hypothetical protein